MSYYLIPYVRTSKSVRALKEALPAKSLKLEDSNYAYRENHVVINWGRRSPHPNVPSRFVLNTPAQVSRLALKDRFFRQVSDYADPPRVPQWTTDLAEALAWDGDVVGRKILDGHSGAGIVFQTDLKQFPSCPLYVRYIKKASEWRLHFFKGRIFLIQKKVLRLRDDAGNAIDPEQVDWRIRNYPNGFIYQRHDVEPPDDVIAQAEKFISQTPLDFGALDIIYNRHYGRAYLLEVNSAPGLTGSTVNSYRDVFHAYAASRD